jgi:Flp pilus assembly protein TadD
MHRQIKNAQDAGDGDAVARMLRQRMTADPGNLDVRMQLARHYEDKGFTEIAAEHYRLAAAAFPDNPIVIMSLARTLRALNLPHEALASVVRFDAAHPNSSADMLTWKGILEDEAGDLNQAEKSYRAALALKPKSEATRNNLGYNLLLQARYAEAAAEFRQALEIQPHSAVAQNNLGIALASDHKGTDTKEAVLHMQSISDPATAHSNLAAILMEQGLYTEARKELDIALGYRKDHRAALSNLALISELDGKPSTLPSHEQTTKWKRFSSGLKKVLLGTDDKDHRNNEPAKTASN